MQCQVEWSPELGQTVVKPLGTGLGVTGGTGRGTKLHPHLHHSVWGRGGGGGKKDKVMEEEERRERRRKQQQKFVNCGKKFAAFLFSHIGLAGMVVAYSIMGGFLFQALEAPFEMQVKMGVKTYREDKIDEIWLISEETRIGSLPQDRLNFSRKIRAIFKGFTGEVYHAVKEKGWDGEDHTDRSRLQWSFAGSLLYAVTVITTIGYGHVAPKTTEGRLVTIIYALVGIPLTFLYLSNIGNFLADCFRLFYKRVCCDICCCQQCERKQKERRRQLRMNQERQRLAEQRNIALNVSGDPEEYTAAHGEVIAISDQEYDPPGLPGGDENLAFEVDPGDAAAADSLNPESPRRCDASSPHSVSAASNRNPSRQASQPDHERAPFDRNLRETAILDSDEDDEDEMRETAILDSDVGDSDVRETDILEDEDDDDDVDDAVQDPSTPNSDVHVSNGVLNQLSEARETDILEDSDEDLLEEEAPEVETITHLGSSMKEGTDSKNSKKDNKKKEKELKKEQKHKEREKKKLEKEKEKAKKLLEKQQSKEQKKATSTKKDKDKNKKEKDKDKDKDKKKDKSKGGDKDLRDELDVDNLKAEEEGSSSAGATGHESSFKLQRGKSTKQSKKALGKNTNPAQRKDTILRRKPSSKRGNVTMDKDEGPGDYVRQKRALHNSDDSFVTAQGDSISELNRADSDEDVDDDDDIVDDDEEEEDEDDPEGGYRPHAAMSQLSTKEGLGPDSVAVDVDTDYMELMDYSIDGGQLGDAFEYEPENHTGNEKVTVPISICLIIITVYIIGGAVLFAAWEGWDYLTGSYFCFITLSTIGFGDIVPGTDMSKWASHTKLVSCSLWLAFGLSLLAMCFNLMQEEVKEKCKWLGNKLGLLKDEDDGFNT